MLSGTAASGRWVTIIPRSPLPSSRNALSFWKPGPVAPSLSSPGARKDVSAGSTPLATLSRYSTAPAPAGSASATQMQTATAASMDRSVPIEPPDFGIAAIPKVCHPEARGARNQAPVLRVQILARRGLRPAHAVPLLAQEELVEADRPARERHGRAGQIQEPRPIRPLAHDGARLVGAGLETLHPLAARARVVEAEVLHVEDFPARTLDLRHRLGDTGQIAVGEDVLVEEIGLARPLPMELVMDAVVEVEPAVVQHLPDATEEGGIVRHPHVLDDSDGRDLVVAGSGGQVAVVAVLDDTAAFETLPLDARGRPVGLGAGEGHPVRDHSVVLGRPDGEAAPAAADIEERLAGLEPELAAAAVYLVFLRLLQLAVGLGVLGGSGGHA